MTGSFGEANGPRDDGAEDLWTQMSAKIFTDLLAEAGAGVVHGENNSEHGEGGVKFSLFNPFDQTENLAHPFEGKVLALDGDKNLVGGDESTGHEKTDAGGAIEDDEIKGGIVPEGCEGIADTEQRVFHSSELHFCPRQIHLRGKNLKVFLARRLEHVEGAGIPDEDGVETFTRDDFEPKAAGGVGLGVEIDEENTATCFSGASG